jgi:hypothetical protein
MKKIVFYSLFIIIWSLICIFIGYYLNEKFTEPITITKYETQWKDKVVYKNLTLMTEKEKDKELQCYYQSEFKLDINKNPFDDNKYRITGSLCERSAYKDFEIECNSTENWRMYLGIGIVGAASGIILYNFVK